MIIHNLLPPKAKKKISTSSSLKNIIQEIKKIFPCRGKNTTLVNVYTRIHHHKQIFIYVPHTNLITRKFLVKRKKGAEAVNT